MSNDAEAKFNEIVSDFKKAVDSAVNESLDRIHGEMVPYLNDDTESNAIYRAVDIVKSIMSGSYSISDEGVISVNGWRIEGLTNYNHDKLVDKLAERCSDMAAQKKIERLEEQLKEAWSAH